jgi:hypothetical protein
VSDVIAIGEDVQSWRWHVDRCSSPSDLATDGFERQLTSAEIGSGTSKEHNLKRPAVPAGAARIVRSLSAPCKHLTRREWLCLSWKPMKSLLKKRSGNIPREFRFDRLEPFAKISILGL